MCRGILYIMRTFVVAVLLLAATVAPGQTSTSKGQGKDELRFTLILSRHGIRPPLTPNSTLNTRSSDPWPEWPVPLGFLTPHGAEASRQMGAYLRLNLAGNGLLPIAGCPDSSAIYLYSDTDERNIMSSLHTMAGLEPGCGPRPIHTIVPATGVRDPLFSPIPGTFPLPPAEAVASDRQAVLGSDPTAYLSVSGNPELTELAHLLAPDPAHPAAKPILDDPKPLAAAPSLIEDFQLEYINGRPMPEVGWGRVDESAILRLLPLHVKGFALTTRTPLSARTRGSNLMAHILDTLEQAAQTSPAQPVPGALGPAGARLVYISGHDSNLFNIGGLLNLHWTVEGIADDTPPDSQIVFELWQNPASKQWSVRLVYRAQTLDQLRSAQALTLASPPVEVILAPPGCSTAQPCAFAAFDKAAHALLDPAYIKPDLPPTQIAPINP